MSEFTLDKPIIQDDGTILVIVRNKDGKQVGHNLSTPNVDEVAGA